MKPNVIIAVDTSSRMQNDADETYYDPNDYVRSGALWEASLSVDPPTSRYRRKYYNLLQVFGGSDRMTASRIETVGDDEGTAYTHFYGKTRLSVARLALGRALIDNTSVTRFGLIKMRQNEPCMLRSHNYVVFRNCSMRAFTLSASGADGDSARYRSYDFTASSRLLICS